MSLNQFLNSKQLPNFSFRIVGTGTTHINLYNTMAKEIVYGDCAICGEYSILNEEHLPPKKAFNNVKYTQNDILELLKYKQSLGHKNKNEPKQGGIRFNSLCVNCNNFTGTKYVTSYIKWCQNGDDILKKTNFSPTLYYNYRIFPLKVIKQIITMFFTVNRQSESFRISNPELVEFVKNPNKRTLSPKYQVYCYLTHVNFSKQSGLVTLANINNDREPIYFTEFNFSPFGYLMTIDTPIIKDLLNISYFADAGQYDLMNINLQIPVLRPDDAMFGFYYDLNDKIISPFKNIV